MKINIQFLKFTTSETTVTAVNLFIANGIFQFVCLLTELFKFSIYRDANIIIGKVSLYPVSIFVCFSYLILFFFF